MIRDRFTRWSSRPIAVLAVLGLVAASTLAAVPAFADPPLTGTSVVQETFRAGTVSDDAWKALGDTCLSGAAAGSTPPPGSALLSSCASHQSGPVPPVGVTDGYLQLTDTGFRRAGSILYDRPIPASSGLSVTFEQYQYGGNGADGIGFYLVDGSTNLDAIGGPGGSLGYAQFTDGQPGIPGGYIGVGLDAYGNYYSDGDGRGTGCPAGSRSPSTWSGPAAPNVITVRGPGNGGYGYCWLGATIPLPVGNPYSPGTTLNGGAGTLRANTLAASQRTVNVTVDPSSDPNPQVRVQVQYVPGGPWISELTIPEPPDSPATFKFGLSGSTGYSQDVHLLRNLVVRTVDPLPALVLEKQVDRSGPPLPAVLTAGTSIPYIYTVTDTGGPVTDLIVEDDRVATTTCARTTLDGTAGADTTTCTGSYTVTAADVASGIVTNIAQASADGGGGTIVQSPQRSVTVPLVSRLSLQKSVLTAGPYRIGQQVNYSYLVQNTGGSALSDVSINDDRIAASDLRCPQTTLAPNATVTCAGSSVIAPADLDADGYLVNTAIALGDTVFGQVARSAQRQVSLPVAVDVALTKTVDNEDPVVGDTITFTVTAANHGPAVATGLVVTDTLPGTGPDQRFVYDHSSATGGTYNPSTGGWEIPTLAVGASVQLRITGRVGSGTSFTNSASVSELDQPDRDPSNDRAVVTVNALVPTADIAVSKVSSVSSVAIGGVAIFTLRATNGGPFAASGVSVSDVLPVGLTFVPAQSGGDGTYDSSTGVWAIGNLAVGGSAVRRIAVRATELGSFTNLAHLRPTASPTDSEPGNDTASADLRVIRAQTDLSVIKSVSTASAVVGDSVTFHLAASNAGPIDAVDVRVVDAIPDGLFVTAATTDTGTISSDGKQWTVGSLPADGTVAEATITATVSSTGTYINTATISSPSVSDTVPGNNVSSASVHTTAAALDVGVTKTAVVQSGAQIDAVPVGELIDFTLTATNYSSTTAATGMLLSDVLPTGLDLVSNSGDGSYDETTGRWTVGALAAGASASQSIVARVVAPGDFFNTLSLASLDQTDTDSSNDSATVGGSGFITANLAISKSASPLVVRRGDATTFTVTVRNNGPDDATGVTVADPSIPDGSVVNVSQGTWDTGNRLWSVGSLADAATATLTVSVPMMGIGVQQNIAAVIGFGQPDPDLDDNIASAEVYVPAADLIVTAAVDDQRPTVGDTVTLSVGIANAGPDASGIVDLATVIPDGLRLVSTSSTAGSFDENTGVWSLHNLEPVDLPVAKPQEALTLRAVVEREGSLNFASSADRSAVFAIDPDPSTNAASVVMVATSPRAELVTGKEVLSGGRVGDPVVYRLSVRNSGDGPAKDVVLTDVMPPGLAAASVSSADCSVTNETLSCDFGTLASAQSTRVDVTAQAVAPGTIVNTAAVRTSSELAPTSVLTASASLDVAGAAVVPTTVPTTGPTRDPGTGDSDNDAGTGVTGGLADTGGPLYSAQVAAVALILIPSGIALVIVGRRRRGIAT